MSDYYDSWSANSKRRKNPTHPHLRPGVGLDGARRRSPLQHSPNRTAALTATMIAREASGSLDTATTRFLSSTASSPQILHPTPPLPSFSPALQGQSTYTSWETGALPDQESTVTPENSRHSLASQKPKSVWRFSRILFDSSTRTPPKEEDMFFDADYDDADEDDDDEEEEEHEEETEKRLSCLTAASTAIPEGPVMPNHHRRFMHLSEYQPRRMPIHEQYGEYTIEQVNPLEDSRSSSPPFLDSLARPHPSLMSLSPTASTSIASLADHPQSTSTFNTRLHPISILRTNSSHTVAADQSTSEAGRGVLLATSVSTRRKQRQLRPRPWSQVIWQSPVLEDAPQRHQGHSCKRGELGGSEVPYPALSKDLFAGNETKPEKVRDKDRDKYKDKDFVKSVRINMESSHGIISGGKKTPHRLSLRPLENGLTNSPFLISQQRREHNYSRNKQMNRLSLGSGFYASLEPVSLANGTPLTPRVNKRRNLVRLPVRPQSVLIPSSPRPYSQGQGSAASAIATFQPLMIDASKRRRHRSQQLEAGRVKSPPPVPIPWVHFQNLAPMKPEDNRRTFHGLSSLPTSTASSSLARGRSQDGALPEGGSILESGWMDSSLQQQRRSSLSKQQPVLVTEPSKSLPQNQAPKRQRNSRLFPALFESSSSFFFKKPLKSSSLPTSSSSSPNIDVSPDTPAFTSYACSSSHNYDQGDANAGSYVHLSQHQDQQHPQHYQQPPLNRLSKLHTRQSLPVRVHTNAEDNNNSNSGSINSNDSSPKAAVVTMTTNITMPNSSSPLLKQNSTPVLLPFTSVSYESGSLLGGIKNSSSTICTSALSSMIVQGAPLPPGAIVNTIGVSSPPPLSQHSRRNTSGSLSTNSSGGSTNRKGGESNKGSPSEEKATAAPISQDHSVPKHRIALGEDEESYGDSSSQSQHRYTYESRPEKVINSGSKIGLGADHEKEGEGNKDESCFMGEGAPAIVTNGSVMMQKSHVAVYEINPRWGSRLMMLLVTLGGILCVISGGLCAEHHCKDLRLCQDDHQTHGNWCGPSGVEGAPYLLAVGLFMCTFGFYALVHLRLPISRLVGYSEIDQVL